MRIAMLMESFWPLVGGGERRYYEIAKRLSRKHEIHVFTVKFSGLLKEEDVDNIHVHRITPVEKRFNEKGEHAYKHGINFALYLSLRKTNSIFRDFDIIDLNQWPITLPVFLVPALKLGRASTILTWHEVRYNYWPPTYNKIQSQIGNTLEVINSRIVDHHVAVSNTTMNRLITQLKIPPNRISNITNGVDLSSFSSTKNLKVFGKIVYAGQLLEHKHVDWLILAYSKVKKIVPDTELHIVGTGPMLPTLRNLATRLNLSGVIFHGHVSDNQLIEILKSSWLFVLPSTREGQGIVLLEAMAAGLLPIAINVKDSGVKDVIQNGWNGLLAEPNVDSIAEKIISVLKSENLYVEMTENGLKYVSNFDWDEIAATVEKLYDNLR